MKTLIVTFAIAILLWVFPTANAQTVGFELVETHVITDKTVLEPADFYPLSGYAYFVQAGGYGIQRYNLSTRTIDLHTGGKGNGPGEFAKELFRLRAAEGRLYAISIGGEIHIFSPDLRLETRDFKTFTPSDIVDLGSGKLLTCATSLSQAKTTGSMHNLAMFRPHEKNFVDYALFSLPLKHPNYHLSECFVADGGRHIIAGRRGDNRLYYYDREGSQSRTVQFEKDMEHRFTEVSHPNRIVQMYASYGLNDLRLPDSGFLSGLYANDDWTVARGGLSSPNKMSTLYLINHATWEVSTVHLKKKYRHCVFDGGRLYALLMEDRSLTLDIYTLKP